MSSIVAILDFSFLGVYWSRLSISGSRLSRGSLVGLVKSAGQILNANTNMYAPSVAEADALLESFGFVDADALLAA